MGQTQKTKNRKRKNDKKMPHNCPPAVQHDRQFKHQGGGDYGFNPMRPSDVGGKSAAGIMPDGKKVGGLTDADRKTGGKNLGAGADFGSWQAPSRRLNPKNKQDAKIIARGVDSIARERYPYLPCQNINKAKYNENFNEIEWGSKAEVDKNGVRKPKRTKKVYK